MAKITEELTYHVKIDAVELNMLNNNESFKIDVAGIKILLSR